MKKITSIIAIITLSIAFSTTASAQVTANAPTTATIVAPIGITKNVDMKFGNVAVSSTTGTVLMTASATPTRTPSGGVTLPAATGTPTAAKFTVTGEGVYTYAITLPTSALTLDESGVGTATMTVSTFTSTPSATGTLTAGSQIVYVGATLNVGASQVAGLYENTTGFAVTVNYN